MRALLLIIFFTFYDYSVAQIIPNNRVTDWSVAGLNDTSTNNFSLINMESKGFVGDSLTPNDSVLNEVLQFVKKKGSILLFPKGNFLFNKTINLPNNVVLRGKGANSTQFIFNLNKLGHSISIIGEKLKDTSFLSKRLNVNNWFIDIYNTTAFKAGDWVQVFQNDTHLITSSWAKNTIGQIIRIKSISGNRLYLHSPARLSIELDKKPYIQKLKTKHNIGIECIKILRLDNTAPQQSSNIHFKYATNCWVNAIESENCTFSHIEARNSSNLSIMGSYMHHGFEYGGNGRAYGLMLHITTNECLVVNNIFKHLRHSMIVQAGANGNVFAYNYSTDPYWSSTPNDAAGDMVLHGNYPSYNLFEQNICQNIIIDNSHGPNGANNTFLRNRAELFGIFFSADNSPNQSFIGNEITNTTFPYSVVNYTILGKNHYLYGNDNKGVISPPKTDTITLKSLYYTKKPKFVNNFQWAGIGFPHTIKNTNIPAQNRFSNGYIFNGMCENKYNGLNMAGINVVKIYPNPTSSHINIQSKNIIRKITFVDINGRVVITKEPFATSFQLSLTSLEKGIYHVLIQEHSDRTIYQKLIVY